MNNHIKKPRQVPPKLNSMKILQIFSENILTTYST